VVEKLYGARGKRLALKVSAKKPFKGGN
jgi:hypothetical protein